MAISVRTSSSNISREGSPSGPLLDLRSPLGVTPLLLDKEPILQSPRASKSAQQAPKARPELARRSYDQFSTTRRSLLRSTSKRRLQAQAVDFRRIWWDKGARSPCREGMSLWRPNPPPGYVALGELSISFT